MSARTRYRLSAAVVLLTLVACSVFGPTKTPTPPSPSATPKEAVLPTPSSSPSATATPLPAPTTPAPHVGTECDANLMLESLRKQMDYAEFSVHYNTLQGERTLVIWFVEPSLDPLAEGEAITDNLELAVVRALALSHRLNLAQPCVAERFDVINAIVVDQDYNGWFSGKIPPSLLPRVEEPSDEELLHVKFEANYLRQVQTPKAGRQPAPSGSCTWAEARRKARTHFGDPRPNVDFYFVIDEVGVNVWAQWDSRMTPLEGDFSSPLNVAMEVACVHPALDWLWMFVVAEDGNISFLGRVPGDAVRSDDFPTQVIQQMEVLLP